MIAKAWWVFVFCSVLGSIVCAALAGTWNAERIDYVTAGWVTGDLAMLFGWFVCDAHITREADRD